METQLFENKNASTEIIGPVVLNLRTGIPYFFSDPSTERHLATVTSSIEFKKLLRNNNRESKMKYRYYSFKQ
jgi:hypothetical protein